MRKINPKMKMIIKEIENKNGSVRANEIINFFDSNSAMGKEKANEENRMARQTVRNMLKEACDLKKLVRREEREGFGLKVWYEIPKIRKEFAENEKDWVEYVIDCGGDLTKYLEYIKTSKNLKSEELAEIFAKMDLTIKIFLDIVNGMKYFFGNTKKWKEIENAIMKLVEQLTKEEEKYYKKHKNIRKQFSENRIDLLEDSFIELEDTLKKIHNSHKIN